MRRDGATTFCAFFDEKTEYIDGAVIVKNLPVSVFLIATAWPYGCNNGGQLLERQSFGAAGNVPRTRAQRDLSRHRPTHLNYRSNLGLYESLPKWINQERRHFAIDGQSCQSARHH